MALALRSAFLITQRGTHWSTWIFNKRLLLGLPGAVMDVPAAQAVGRVGPWTRDRHARSGLISMECDTRAACAGCLMWRGLCSRSERDIPNYGTWIGYMACTGPGSLGLGGGRK